MIENIFMFPQGNLGRKGLTPGQLLVMLVLQYTVTGTYVMGCPGPDASFTYNERNPSFNSLSTEQLRTEQHFVDRI